MGQQNKFSIHESSHKQSAHAHRMIERHHANGTFKERILVLNNMGLSSTCFIEMRTWHTFRASRCTRSVEHDGNGSIRKSWHCLQRRSTPSQVLKGIRASACANSISPG